MQRGYFIKESFKISLKYCSNVVSLFGCSFKLYLTAPVLEPPKTRISLESDSVVEMVIFTRFNTTVNECRMKKLFQCCKTMWQKCLVTNFIHQHSSYTRFQNRPCR